MSLVYTLHKGVSSPLVFRGLKAQYIGFLAIGVLFLLLLFAFLYLIGLSLFFILPLIAVLGLLLFWAVQVLSKRFGVHGLKKYWASKRLPKAIRFRGRKQFMHLIHTSPCP